MCKKLENTEVLGSVLPYFDENGLWINLKC